MKRVAMNISDHIEERETHDRRLGRFRVSIDLMDQWEYLLAVMKHFVVVEATTHYADRCIHYTAYSPLFEPAPLAAEVPWYELQVRKNNYTGEISVEALLLAHSESPPIAAPASNVLSTGRVRMLETP